MRLALISSAILLGPGGSGFDPSTGSLRVIPALSLPPTLWKFGKTGGQLRKPVPLIGTPDHILAADFDTMQARVLARLR